MSFSNLKILHKVLVCLGVFGFFTISALAVAFWEIRNVDNLDIAVIDKDLQTLEQYMHADASMKDLSRIAYQTVVASELARNSDKLKTEYEQFIQVIRSA